ncbi:MAG: DarT1-associated NADAR antitoxin family protein [Vulcanimicrobiaceae bacterium]
MAERPIFIPSLKPGRLVDEISVSFLWHKGMAPSQKKKNVLELHAAAAKRGLEPLLEVSTKSEEKLGQRLSAFNLKVELDDGGTISLECAFQGSKVFENGGPFTDLFGADSREAKRDVRLTNSGGLTGFRFEGQDFPLIPKTAFYDWLYIRALYPHREFLQRLHRYAGFTDIEFNPEKSINCQARSCATYVALDRLDLLSECANSSERFMQVLLPDSLEQPHSDKERQKSMFG